MRARQSFLATLDDLPPRAIQAHLEMASHAVVERALAEPAPTLASATALLSPAAGALLEPMAQTASRLTRLRFGRTMTFYAPVYLSSYCDASCRYCGFAHSRAILRRALTPQEVAAEVACVVASGIRHVLLVTGDARGRYGVREICAAAAAARPLVASLSAEVFAMDLTGYQALADVGVDGLVLYQETYDPVRYRELHPAGPKRDFAARVRAVEAAGAAGLHSLGIGALLGLSPPAVEGVYLALHASHLQAEFPQARIAVSFPRLCPLEGGLAATAPCSDRMLVQLLVALRLMLPDVELVLSTREPPALRDRLLPLGVTRISAASCTAPGGYGDATEPPSTRSTAPPGEQFGPRDARSAAEVMDAVLRAGFEVVRKDFDRALI